MMEMIFFSYYWIRKESYVSLFHKSQFHNLETYLDNNLLKVGLYGNY